MSFPVDKAIFHILSHFVSNNSEIDEARRSNICSASYGLQNSPTYMTSLNAHPHSLLMCTQNAYLIVVLYMQTFCLWKWKSPWRMSNLALSIHGTPLHFSKSCSRKTLSLPLPHRRGWSGGKLSKVAQERRAPPCGPGRGVLEHPLCVFPIHSHLNSQPSVRDHAFYLFTPLTLTTQFWSLDWQLMPVKV